jgi:uncharacterized protein with HEPN domain
MAKPSQAERLQHVLEAIEDIEVRTNGLSLEAFNQDRFLRLGIERCLEIISEASRHIPGELKAAHPEIPWVRVADIGNRIRHSYHAVDSEIVRLCGRLSAET